ncbi:MAG: LruC domain-containing protein, partial [Pseudomonadota bacterium]
MRTLFAVPFVLFAQSVWAGPFENCPPDAFLTQGKTPQSFSLNLVTGDYQVAAAQHAQAGGKLNALGFNPVDQYIYGWSYDDKGPVRIHSDFSVETLTVSGLTGANFYVGDVHPSQHEYYVYRRGGGHGLYRIALDPNQP